MSARADDTPAGAGTAPSVALALLAMACFQAGGALAKLLFPAVGANGTSTLRLGLAALIMAAVVRPWQGPFPRAAWLPLVVYGAGMAGLNGFFYLAIRTIPIGLAVSIDFLGPLAVALMFSRRLADLAWVGLAALGIGLLTPLGGGRALDPAGLGFSLAAAFSWAVYILAGRRLGALLPSRRATALGIAAGTLFVLPFGVAEAGAALLAPRILPLALAVAVLSSALPNTLEMVAMTRLPPRVFGVLMSLEPAFGALFGFLMLGERLSVQQGIAVGTVILASAGTTLTTARRVPVPG